MKRQKPYTRSHCPQRQHSCADTVEIQVSQYLSFFNLTHNSRVTPQSAIYLFSQHAQRPFGKKKPNKKMHLLCS